MGESSKECDLDNWHEISTSSSSADPDWDNFLGRIAGNHHVQTTLWAQVNASIGWRAVRIIAREGQQVVGGAQLMFDPSSPGRAVGYVPKGPIFVKDDPALRAAVFSRLSQVAQENGVVFLAIQPPGNAVPWLDNLAELDFLPSKVEIAPTATVLVDLSLDLSEILSQMKQQTRYNIRLSGRNGIRFLEGNAKDIDTFYELLETTSRRKNFPILPKQFFISFWEVFEPYGYIKLFLGEYKGNVISAQLIVAFGNTVVNKLSVWSGEYANCKPNEALQWHSICWAKQHGYRYYDFEGINSEVASAILRGDSIPQELNQSYTSFKLGFGGRIVQLPGVYEHIFD